jgi:hypothetical protein
MLSSDNFKIERKRRDSEKKNKLIKNGCVGSTLKMNPAPKKKIPKVEIVTKIFPNKLFFFNILQSHYIFIW